MPPDGLIRYLHASFAAPRWGDGPGRWPAPPAGTTRRSLLMRVTRIRLAVCGRRPATTTPRKTLFRPRSSRSPSRLEARFGTVAGWLCRVAYHAALKARPRPVASLEHEPVQGVDDLPDRVDLGRALHEELDRLGDRYRAPLVLCYLQGLTHAEAARHLGWPVGTVATRVSRGRDRLRDRLSRRGIVLPAGGLLTAFAAAPGSALPPPLVSAIERAIATGNGLALTFTDSLTEHSRP